MALVITTDICLHRLTRDTQQKSILVPGSNVYKLTCRQMQRKGLGKHNLKLISSHINVVQISGLLEVFSTLSPQTCNSYLIVQLFTSSRIKALGIQDKAFLTAIIFLHLIPGFVHNHSFLVLENLLQLI